ncbi:MAG: sulfatase [Myxococcota bacterium]|nr:sulfatase [Myxococcota bacterium]
MAKAVASALWLGLGAWLLACQPAGPTRDLDLTQIFELAEAATETELIDFGTPEARAHLLRGWGFNQRPGDGRSFVWGLGERSVLGIRVGEPRELRVRFRCWPARLEGAPEASLEMFVAGAKVGEARLEPRPSWYAVRVPPTVLVAGENRIELRYARHAPSQGPPPGVPALGAVAFDRLEIPSARSFGLPQLAGGAEPPEAAEPPERLEPVLRLPFRSSLSFFWRLPAGGELRFAAVDAWGGAAGSLDVDVQPAGTPVPTRSSLEPGSAVAVELPAATGPVRVVLRATLRGEVPETPAGLDLRGPLLRVPVVEGGAPAARSSPAEPSYVFVYLIDTLRPDHLGVYGYERPTSPHIDAFARDATLFRNAVAQTSWTRPAVASLFTGLNPPSHGVVRPDRALAPDVATLPEVLAGLGYQTWGVTTNGNVAPAFGFGRGFDRYHYLPENDANPEMHQLSDRVNEIVFGWLSRRRDERPLFLLLHTTDPHSPYTPRAPFRERLAASVRDPEAGTRPYMRRLQLGEPAPPGGQADVRALYDAEIAFNDAQFGAFLEKLKELGLYESSLIILLSDHGEAFAEHGSWQHGTTLYNEVVAIPLIIRFPGGVGRGQVVETLARQVDVLPTVLDVLGKAPIEGLEGRSLLADARGGNGREGPPAGVTAYAHLSRRRGEWASATQTGRQLIRTRAAADGAERVRLFDLERDPLQRHDLAEMSPVWRGYLLSQLEHVERRPRRHGDAPTAEIDADLRERLQALGYL